MTGRARPSIAWWCRALGVLLLTAPIVSGQVARPDAHGFIHVTPDDLAWGTGSAIQSIVIAGDPNKPGIYVIRNRFPPGQMSRPHCHNQDRFVTVIKGTWWTATGPDADVFNSGPGAGEVR